MNAAESYKGLPDEQKCTACGACVQACSRKCLKLDAGILNVDANICVRCGACTKVCPIINLDKIVFRKPQKAFASWALDPKERKSSASGGMASVFYRYAAEHQWKFCGAACNQDLLPYLKLTDVQADISKFKGSKYVHASTENVFHEIKRALQLGEYVLFISVPCQVAALKQVVGNSNEKLISVDIVCHGVPDSFLLKEYIELRKENETPTMLFFRDENVFGFSLRDKNNSVIYEREGRTDEYMAAFLEGLSYREACYGCNFARPERISDITICDFWGLGAEMPFDHPYTGAISAVLINTEKGRSFFEKCKKYVFCEERPVSEAIKGNAQLNSPTQEHPLRELYLELKEKEGFTVAVRKCLGKEMKIEGKQLRKRKVRKCLSSIKHFFIP